MWDPGRYERYADERGRPFVELVSRIGAGEPRSVVDLGCGTGGLTATLLDRWPAASVLGIDSSTEMLAAAAGLAVPGRLEFRPGRIEEWRPDGPVDVVVSNAALQWVPDVPALLDRFVEALTPGGWLAFQVPGNFSEPSHRLLAEARRSDRWRPRLGAGADREVPVEPVEVYVDWLCRLGCSVDAWETTYLHILAGMDPVLDWVRGTALRPVLARLSASEAAEFEREYGELLRAAYPARPYGTVFPFRRVFVVARTAVS